MGASERPGCRATDRNRFPRQSAPHRLSLGAWCGEFLKCVTARVMVPTTLASHWRGLAGYSTGFGCCVTTFGGRATTFRGCITTSSDRGTSSSDRVTGFREVDCEPTNRVTSLVERRPGFGKRGTSSISVTPSETDPRGSEGHSAQGKLGADYGPWAPLVTD